MKLHRNLSAGALLAGLLCSAAALPSSAATAYSFTDLGTLTGYTDSSAVAINSGGAIAGYSSTYDLSHRVATRAGMVWTPGAGPMALAPDAGYAGLALGGINRGGQVSGFNFNTDGVSLSGADAFIWSPSTGRQALASPQGAILVAAVGLNDPGQVAGYVWNGSRYLAILWNADRSATVLPEIGQGFNGLATQVNAGGTVLLTANNGTSNRNFTWSAAAGYTELTLAPGYVGSNAFDIDSAGRSTGFAYDAGNVDSAALWNADGSVTLLGTLPGTAHGVARGISDNGQVVGYAFTQRGVGVAEGFVWTAAGGMQNLRSLLDPHDPGVQQLQSIVPYDVNDAGQIVGYATIDGVQHAFLLSPVPEVSIQALMFAGLAALAWLMRRRPDGAAAG